MITVQRKTYLWVFPIMFFLIAFKYSDVHLWKENYRIAKVCKLLQPAYVVRREGNVLTRVCLSVCPQGGTHIP